MKVLGGFAVQDFQAATSALEGIDPLQKFVLAYANVAPDGRRLTSQVGVYEALLFAIWLEACAKLDLRPSDPNVTVAGQPL